MTSPIRGPITIQRETARAQARRSAEFFDALHDEYQFWSQHVSEFRAERLKDASPLLCNTVADEFVGKLDEAAKQAKGRADHHRGQVDAITMHMAAAAKRVAE